MKCVPLLELAGNERPPKRNVREWDIRIEVARKMNGVFFERIVTFIHLPKLNRNVALLEIKHTSNGCMVYIF